MVPDGLQRTIRRFSWLIEAASEFNQQVLFREITIDLQEAVRVGGLC